MEVRYYVNPVTGLPHIYDHGVTEAEVERVLNRPGEDGPSSDGSRQALGQSEGGRYLRVVYVPDEDGEGVFVVTAYRLAGRELKAYRRRKRSGRGEEGDERAAVPGRLGPAASATLAGGT
ncbi:MAG: DUF4258 domain-containing protein [Isosphaeraceae bacterium]